MTMKLYGFWRSLATYRVRVALGLKGLKVDELSIPGGKTWDMNVEGMSHYGLTADIVELQIGQALAGCRQPRLPEIRPCVQTEQRADDGDGDDQQMRAFEHHLRVASMRAMKSSAFSKPTSVDFALPSTP